jgi:HlyD family secretion protein
LPSLLRCIRSLNPHWRSCLLLGSVTGWLACGAEPEAPPPSAEVLSAAIERIVIATGTVEPATEVEVRPRIAGIVEKIHVAAGDRVERGQPLVEIERELMEAQVREARAALSEADVELHFAGIAVEREQKMRKRGASSEQRLDDAMARHQRSIALRERAQAGLDTLTTQLGYATVKASMAGRVLEVYEEEGSAVSPVTSVTGGTLLLSLAGDEVLHLEGLVDENEIVRVALGQRARIRTEAFAGRIFEGEVREIAPLGQRVQNVTYFEVEIEITDVEAKLLRPRMSGDAEIVTEVVEDAVVVPETALHYRGEDIYVVLAGEAAPEAERVVEIGIVDGDQVQVLTGVSPGERVLVQ